jgi:hypothetical protein
VLSVRPKVAELAFQVFGRSLHPELFEIHRSRRFERAGYEAKIDITNSGHVITWRGGGHTLTEVASSAQQPLPQRRRLVAHQLRGGHADQLECRGGVTYETHFHLEPVSMELFFAFHGQLSAESTDGLLHNFDASGRMALGAFSYIHVETRTRSMRVQAVHTFPDDYAMVKVESVFSLPK